MMRKTLLYLLTLTILVAPGLAQKSKRAKNVILLLADAGGISTVNAASLVGYDAPQKLFVQSWPQIGLSDTSTASRWVTDSAAGMTAIVTGRKTHNGVISQDADTVRGKKDGTELKTILEYAEEHGLSTGVISNVTIADATPGACYGHSNDRRNLGPIFADIFKPRFGDGVDVVFGPGRKRIWDNAKTTGLDLDALAKEKNRTIYQKLDEVPADSKRALVVVDEGFELERAVKMALSSLAANRKGFFLMIESDAHTDNPEAGINRLIAFDKLIREISTIVNPRETLLLFTADHSFDLRVHGGTRGEPLLQDYAEWKRANEKTKAVRLKALSVFGSHTGEEVLVAAMGPGSERVHGFMANTDLFDVMLQAFGWKR
jgi:alkaline phosphatase